MISRSTYLPSIERKIATKICDKLRTILHLITICHHTIIRVLMSLNRVELAKRSIHNTYAQWSIAADTQNRVSDTFVYAMAQPPNTQLNCNPHQNCPKAKKCPVTKPYAARGRVEARARLHKTHPKKEWIKNSSPFQILFRKSNSISGEIRCRRKM